MGTDNTQTEQDRLTRLLMFLGHDPENISLLCDAMGLASAVGSRACAQQLIEHVKRHAIDDPNVFAHLSHLLLQTGDYSAAGSFGDKAIEAGINNPAVFFNTAFGHFYSGDYDSADVVLSRLTRDSECTSSTLLMHARALYQLEQTEDAQALIIRAQQGEPDNLEVRGLLALLLYENDKNTLALSTAHDTLIHDPDQLDALIACATVQFEQHNIAASRKVWLHAVNAHPECGRAWFGLAQLEFNELEFESAEEHLKRAVQFMPEHIGTWHLFAWIYILRNDSTQARQALDKAYELDRSFGETHGGLAVVSAMEGKIEQARTGIRRALKLNPNSLSAHYAEALLLQGGGQPEKARQMIEQVLDQTRPESHATGRMLVNCWLEMHNKAPRL